MHQGQKTSAWGQPGDDTVAKSIALPWPVV